MNRHPNILQRTRSALIVVDVQERFAPVIPNFERIEKKMVTLIKGCKLMELPVFYTEQYPKGLGRTTATLRQELEPATPYEKLRFSAAGDTDLLDRLVEQNSSQIILCGIEAHVCMLQSALDFTQIGYQVHVVADATGSRFSSDQERALQRMVQQGDTVTSTESVLFELAETSGTDEFRQISALVK